MLDNVVCLCERCIGSCFIADFMHQGFVIADILPEHESVFIQCRRGDRGGRQRAEIHHD